MLSPTTNIAALVAKRNLNENSLQATRSIAKVSQGTRIVKPMDDAASLAISNSMRTSLAGMTQGIRNTTQGSSLLQIAAGGMEQTSQMLTRMKQLAVQVINDTLGTSEIAYANEEFGQLMQQIDATAHQTRFSGKSLLTGGSDNVIYANINRTFIAPNANLPDDADAARNIVGVDTSAFAIERDFPHEMFRTPGVTEVKMGPQTSGYISHVFPASFSDIDVQTSDGGIRVNIGGEYFAGSTAVKAGGHLVLTSEVNSDNVLAIGLSDDISTIQTDANLALRLRQFLAGSTLQVGESKSLVTDENLPWQAAGFDTLSVVNPAKTRGIIQGIVRHASDINIQGQAGNYTVDIVIGGQSFRASRVNPQPGEALILKSLDVPGTQLALNYSEDPVNVIGDPDNNRPGRFSTAADFKSTLERLLINYDGFMVGGVKIDKNRLDIFEGAAFGNLGRRSTEGRHMNPDVAEVIPYGGAANGPPWDIRVSNGGETFRAVIDELNMTINDSIYLVSTSNEDNVIMLSYTAVGGGADNDPYTNADIDTFRTHLSNIVNGSNPYRKAGDFKIGDPQGVALDYSDSLENGFSGLDQTLTKGFIDGTAKNIRLEGPEGGPYRVSVQVGDQIFTQPAFGPTFSGSLILVSETDPDNVIAYKISGNAKVDGQVGDETFPNANLGGNPPGTKRAIGVNSKNEAAERLSKKDKLLPALESLFGIGDQTEKAPAKFFSASAVNDGYNGVSMGKNKSFVASVGTEPGKYAVSYDGESRIAKLTSGDKVFEVQIDPANIYNGQTSISFGNGIAFRLGDDVGNNPFDPSVSISQMVFEVKATEDADLAFQVSDISRDDMDIKVEAMTVSAIGLTGANINGKEQARQAQEKIDLAITAINTGLANIGAQQSRFEFVRVNLTIQMENTTAARATYYDVDMAGEITDFTKFQTLTQAATSMLSQANQIPQELLRLLP